MRKLLLFGLLSACGYTDAGDGSRTLEVTADVKYDFGDNESELEVRVRKNAVLIDNATVKITADASGTEYLVPFLNQGNNGLNSDTIQGYHRRLKLRVDSGQDFLEAQLEGPGPHTIAAPLNGTRLTRGDVSDGLEVKWKTEDGVRSDEVTVTSRRESDGELGSNNTLTEDEGSFEINGSSLSDGPNVIEVTRRTNVVLAGGTGQSYFKIHYAVESQLVIQ